MQTRSPSLAQIGKKKNLTGADAGRALLISTAASAATGEPAPLPMNVAQFIVSIASAPAADQRMYQKYFNLCQYLAQARATADAHAIRAYAYLVSSARALETSYALEQAMRYFGKERPDQLEAAYREKAAFTGYGLESHIDALYEDASFVRTADRQDQEQYRESAVQVAAYNAALTLIEEAARVRLDSLRLDPASLDAKAEARNASAEKLSALLKQDAFFPFARERAAVLAADFQPVTPVSSVALSKMALENARERLVDLDLFAACGESLTDLLTVDDL